MPRDRRKLGSILLQGKARVARRRVRRTPEQARRELLDAADRVFGEFSPDQVGLKDIAREAGVSHALITHYFGTYAGLVGATLERRLGALRERILLELRRAGVLARPGELLGLLFDALADPVHLKLLKWLSASERAGSMQTLALEHRGLQLVAQQVANVMSPGPSATTLDTLELAILTAVAAAYGYALHKHALVAALGRRPSAALDDAVRDTLAGMLQSYLQARLGASIPP
jgi:AcrR family transcriptional regulator